MIQLPQPILIEITKLIVEITKLKLEITRAKPKIIMKIYKSQVKIQR